MERMLSRRDLMGEFVMVGGGLITAGVSEANSRLDRHKSKLLDQALAGEIPSAEAEENFVTKAERAGLLIGLIMGSMHAIGGALFSAGEEVVFQNDLTSSNLENKLSLRSRITRRGLLKRSAQLSGAGVIGFGGYQAIQAISDESRAVEKQIDLMCGGPARQNCVEIEEVSCGMGAGVPVCGARTEFVLKTPTPDPNVQG